MRAFRFHLQPVLKVRALEEKQSFSDLQEALNALRSAQNRLDSLKHQRTRTESDVRSYLTSADRLSDVVSLQRRLTVLERGITSQHEIVHGLSEIHQRRVDAYLACRRRREALDRLREKAWFTFLYDMGRAQQVEIDDLAVRSMVA